MPGVTTAFPTPDIHANRPAAASGAVFYSCTTHSLIYRSDGTTWTTWATLGASGALADQGVITYLDGTVASAPATPAAGKLRVYAKTGKVLAIKDDAGLETVLGQGIADQGTITFLDATGAAAPANPAAGKARIYAKTDGRIYSRTSAGVEYGPFDVAGGAAAPLLYADNITGGSLVDPMSSVAGWTFGGGMSSSSCTAVTTEVYDATCYDCVFAAAGDRMYKTWSGDGTAYLTIHGITNSTPSPSIATGGMIALYLSDNAGTGTGVSVYNDGNVYMWAISGNAYSSSGNILGGYSTNYPAADSSWPMIYRLVKSGSTITGGFSMNGGASYLTNTRTDSTTFTRVGVMRLYTSGGTNPTLRIGRFNNA